jgi:superfamily I DNA/RNA helicase
VIPSAQQEAIFSDVASGEGHTVVTARAGCGKTTTLVKALDFVPASTKRDCLFVAFNKSIATELQARAPQGVTVSTLHSYGLCQIAGAMSQRPQIDGEKLKKISRALSPSSREVAVAVEKLASLAKGQLVTSEEDLGLTLDQFGINLPQGSSESEEGSIRATVIGLAVEALRASREDQKTIDFDDMIWFPNIFKMGLSTYRRVFVDETQDLNRAQVALALKACAKGGRICAAGDPAQAIYAFRGADSYAMAGLEETLAATPLGLSITYRCARAVVDLARRYVPDFQAAPGAPDGTVQEVSEKVLYNGVQPGDFVLSRTNAPLVKVAFRLLRNGMPCHIQGRDIGTKLKAIVTQSGGMSVADFLKKTEKGREREVARLSKLERDTSLVEDTAGCLEALAEGCETVSEISEKIDRLFTGSGSEGKVTLSSTHKAKGLERDRVFLLRDTYLKWPGEEEQNIYYVAITRAKRELYLVRGEGV